MSKPATPASSAGSMTQMEAYDKVFKFAEKVGTKVTMTQIQASSLPGVLRLIGLYLGHLDFVFNCYMPVTLMLYRRN